MRSTMGSMTDRTARAHPRSLAELLSMATFRCGNVETLSKVVFDTVGADVPFAFACLATTDPSSGLINANYKSHPLPMGEDAFAAAEYGAPDINQFSELATRPLPVGVLSVDTDGHPDRCRRMRDYLTPQFGFTDEIRLVCRKHKVTWGLLAVYRGHGQPAFTPAEGRRVASVDAVIADAVRRTVFADNHSEPAHSLAPVVLVVDGANQVIESSDAATAMIEELGGWDHGSLPATVLFVASSSRQTGQPTEGRVLARSGGWLKVRATPLNGSTSHRSLVLTIEPADSATVGAMMIAACGLTSREQDVVGLILRGCSTKDIAAALCLSPHTVQDHLKSIFAKLNVTSRRELIGQFVLT